VFDIGLQEMLVIGVLVVLFFPPEDLPMFFRTAGRWYAKMRRASDDLRRAFNAEVARAEADMRLDDLRQRREAALAARAEAERAEAERATATPPSPTQDATMTQAPLDTVEVAEPPAPRLPPGLTSRAVPPAPIGGVTRTPPGMPPEPTIAPATGAGGEA
jgi:sec-independent protein translocase protein TatB